MNRSMRTAVLVAGAVLAITACGGGGQPGAPAAGTSPSQPGTASPAPGSETGGKGDPAAAPAGGSGQAQGGNNSQAQGGGNNQAQGGSQASGTAQQGSSVTQAATAAVNTSLQVPESLNPPLGQDARDVTLNPLLRASVNTDLRQKKATTGAQEVWAAAPKENAETRFQVQVTGKMRPAEGKDRFYVEARVGFLKAGDEHLKKYEETNRIEPAAFETGFSLIYVVEKDGNAWKLINSNARKLF